MIIFEQAKIVANKQVTGEMLTNRLSVVAAVTDSVCVLLGVPTALAESSEFESVHSASFGWEITEAEITHEIPKLGKLKLLACKASRFRLFREFADRLMVAFTVDYNGHPFELCSHLADFGAGEGTLTIKWPEQQNLIVDENN